MSIIGSRGLDTIRRALRQFLPDQCTIQKPVAVADGSGGETITWTAEQTNVACLIRESTYRGGTFQFAGGQQEQRRFNVYLPQGTSIDAKRRIVQTHSLGIALSPNRIFQIENVIEASYSVLVHLEVVELP